MLKLYLIAVGTAFVVSLAATPVSMFFARRFGALDLLDPRKVHTKIKPRWGGIGIMAGFFASILLVWMFSPSFQKLLQFKRPVFHRGEVVFTLRLVEQFSGILFGALLMFIMGVFDDLKPIKPGVKFLIQIIAAYVAMIYGVRIYGLSLAGFEAYQQFPLWFMQLVTILWLVGLTNAINLIDGLDGLAGGVVAIVAGAFLAAALVQDGPAKLWMTSQMRLTGVIAAALLGGVLGFLVYNFHPAKVFMGDSGSLSMGFLVGCIAVIGMFKTTILAVLVIPFILVAIPIADMTVAFSRRLLKKQNPFAADRSHFHHRLLDAGWTQREVVLFVYAATLLLALISVTVVGIKKP
jgi:UDP-GlcNAc:undecaprenyl-phosphate GlcNAc-1-phosphate transferase